jgi:hypothetical protein
VCARVVRCTGRPNKRMQLTKLRAAPVWQPEVPPCAPAGEIDGGTASQLIRSVRLTTGDGEERDVPTDAGLHNQWLTASAAIYALE